MRVVYRAYVFSICRRSDGERHERERQKEIDREGEKSTRERLFVARNNIILVIHDAKRYP